MNLFLIVLDVVSFHFIRANNKTAKSKCEKHDNSTIEHITRNEEYRIRSQSSAS